MVRKSSDTRRVDFVKATIAVIAEHGVASATTRRIAEASDSPLASLHYVYASKAELFHDVFDTTLDMMAVEVEQPERSPSLHEAVPDLLRRVVGWYVAHPDVARAQWELFFWMLRQDRAAAIRAYDMSVDAFRKVFSRIISREKQADLLEQVSKTALYVVDGILVSWYTYEDEGRLHDEVDRACRTFGDLLAHAAPGSFRARVARTA